MKGKMNQGSDRRLNKYISVCASETIPCRKKHALSFVKKTEIELNDECLRIQSTSAFYIFKIFYTF